MRRILAVKRISFFEAKQKDLKPIRFNNNLIKPVDIVFKPIGSGKTC